MSGMKINPFVIWDDSEEKKRIADALDKVGEKIKIRDRHHDDLVCYLLSGRKVVNIEKNDCISCYSDMVSLIIQTSLPPSICIIL